MEEVLADLFGILNEKIKSEDIRKSIYLDLAPIISWHDPDVAGRLASEDSLFAEAMDEISEENDELYDE